MKTSVVVVVLMACAAVSAQIPADWNYNPFLYYPFTAQPAPVQETAEVAAARAAHLAAHTSAGGSSRVVAVQPVPVDWGQPAGAVLDTPEVWAAKVEHYRAHSAAAAANGVVSTLAPLPVVSWGVPQPVQDTPEVAAARAAHLAAHATARGKRSVQQQDTPEVMAATLEHYRAYNAAAAANGIMAFLPARYANMPFGMPQQVQETPEVAAARRAHLAAHAHAAAQVAKVVALVQPLPSAVVVANQQLANSVAAATNGVIATLPNILLWQTGMLPLIPSRTPPKFMPLKWPFSAHFTKPPFGLVKFTITIHI